MRIALFHLLAGQSFLFAMAPDVASLTLLEADGSASPTNILVCFSTAISEETATSSANYRLTTTRFGESLSVFSAAMVNASNVLLHTEARGSSSLTNYILVVNNLTEAGPEGKPIQPDSMTPVITTAPLLGFYDSWKVYDPFPLFGEPIFPGADWNQWGFVETDLWWSGPGPFVFDPAGADLPVPPDPIYYALSQGSITKYFRLEFNFGASPLGATLCLRHMVDDGVILYLNGQEWHRFNMPLGEAGPIAPAQPAVDIAELVTVSNLPGALLQARKNLLAAELHGVSELDLDWIFGLELKLRVKSYAVGPVVITRQPEDQTVMEGQPVTFSFDGAGPNRFQWYMARPGYSQGAPIAGATNATYTIASTPASYDGASFSVRAQNISINYAISSNALLSVIPDTTPPRLVSAVSEGVFNSVLVGFSEPVDPASASVASNYFITTWQGGNVAVHSASVTNGTSVLLQTDWLPSAYATLQVSQVQDMSTAGNMVPPDSAMRITLQGSFLPMFATWRYLAPTTNLGTAWRYPDYDDSSWPMGPGLFGWPANEPLPFPRVVQTAVPLPEPPLSTTCYFRTWTRFPEIQFQAFQYGLVHASNLIDDGAVFYLNGQEIHRANLPEGNIDHTTPALAAKEIGSNPNPYHVFDMDPLLFRSGDNLFAIEVHQASPTGDDFVFGSELFLHPNDTSVDCFPLAMRIVLEGDAVIVFWTCDELSQWTLLAAPNLNGPWTPVPNQTNPYRTEVEGGPRFFILRP